MLAIACLGVLSACAGGGGRGVEQAGSVKVGKPYQIRGRWYYPVDDRDYQEVGMASWYGPNFHGKMTANGERFDQDDLTAAHRTLPMPSWVRVENLDNGREVELRINDRGPFAYNRIIDVSRRGAQLLGIRESGTARVRVTRLDGPRGRPERAEPRLVVATAEPSLLTATAESAPQASRTVVAATPPPVSPPQPLGTSPPPSQPDPRQPEYSEAPVIRTVPVPGGDTDLTAPKADPPAPLAGAPGPSPLDSQPHFAEQWVQVAALSDPARAGALYTKLSSIAPVKLSLSDNNLVRVRLGPFVDHAEAERVLAQVRAEGYTDARILTDPAS